MELKNFRQRSSPSFRSRSASLEEDQDVYSTLTVQQEILQQEEDGRASEGTDAKGFGEKSITFWGDCKGTPVSLLRGLKMRHIDSIMSTYYSTPTLTPPSAFLTLSGSSCALNFNNITGPAMVVLPLLYQQAGWLLPSIALLGLWALSCIASAMLCEAMQRIPGNAAFARRFEYCPLVRHYLGNRCYYAAMVGFNAGLVASNIAAMIVTAQVLDALVSRMAGFTLGLSYGSWPPQLLVDPLGGSAESCPWGTTGSGACSTSVITLGYFVAAGLCIPLGLLSLGGNMALQWVSTLGQMVFSLHFVAHYLQGLPKASPQFCPGNGPSRTPAVGGDLSQVMGLALFSFSYVSTIPSWVNEKRGGVPVNPALWFPSLAAVSLNMTLAVLGAWSFRLLTDTGQPISGTENILTVLVGRAGPQSYCTTQQVPVQVQVAVYAWGLCGYLPGIPVLAIMVRYNLLNAKLMSPRAAFLTAVVLPWVLTAFFYRAEVLLQFCNWVAILCQGVVNFVVPPLLYRAALMTYPSPPPPPVPASGTPLLDLSPRKPRSPLAQRPGPPDSPLPREPGGMGSDGGECSNWGTEPLIPYQEVDGPEQAAGEEHGVADGEEGVGGSRDGMGDGGGGSSAGRERWQVEEAGSQESLWPGVATGLQSLEKQGFVQEEDAEGAVRLVPGKGRRWWSWLQGEKSGSTGSGADKGEEGPVDALPAWLGVDRIKFATCMALGLTFLVGASITIAVISAVWT